jgi:TatD DNase family protein
MLIDTHAHLSDARFDADRDEVLRRAFDAGISVLVEVGYNEAEWEKARALAERHPGRVFWTAGFHPHEAGRVTDELLRRLRNELAHPQLVAIGEVGLDYYRCAVPPETQKMVFERLARLAVEADKPLILHCREAAPSSDEARRDLMNILGRCVPPAPSDRPAGVAHCFQGDAATARRCLDRGFLIGVDAPVTYPGSAALRDVLRGVPLPSIVLETDCPFLPPQSRRGGRNEPSFLAETASVLANLYDVSVDEIAASTSANARRLFRFPAAASA